MCWSLSRVRDCQSVCVCREPEVFSHRLKVAVSCTKHHQAILRVRCAVSDWRVRGIIVQRFPVGIAAMVALMATPALAADLALKAPPVVLLPVYSWTGPYIGIEGGYGWATRSKPTRPVSTAVGTMSRAGWSEELSDTIGSSTNLCLGLRAMDRPHGSGAQPLERLGVAVARPRNAPRSYRCWAPSAGGSAWPSATFCRSQPVVSRWAQFTAPEGTTLAAGAVGSGSATVAGWTVGGGVEAKLPQNWSIKAQYLYVDLGNQTIFNDTIPFPPPPASSAGSSWPKDKVHHQYRPGRAELQIRSRQPGHGDALIETASCCRDHGIKARNLV